MRLWAPFLLLRLQSVPPGKKVRTKVGRGGAGDPEAHNQEDHHICEGGIAEGRALTVCDPAALAAAVAAPAVWVPWVGMLPGPGLLLCRGDSMSSAHLGAACLLLPKGALYRPAPCVLQQQKRCVWVYVVCVREGDSWFDLRACALSGIKALVFPPRT